MIAASHTLNMVLIGPPGSGKSTIAEALIAERGLTLISTGQRLRAEISARSRIGRTVERAMQRGDLAPDSLMDRVLRAALDQLNPQQGVLLDGYPRTLRQATGLIGLLADHGRTLTIALALDVSDDEVVRRLSGRRICEGAGEQFPVHVDDLASMLRCQERGGRAVQRDDDQPEVVRQRLSVYHGQTSPVIRYYDEQRLLCHVDGRGAPAEVARRALAELPVALERAA